MKFFDEEAKRWVVPLASVPPKIAIHQFLLEVTDFADRIRAFKTSSKHEFLAFPHSFDLSGLKNEIVCAFSEEGGFGHQYPSMTVRKPGYRSLALSTDPDSIDQTHRNPLASGLGSTLFKQNSYSDYRPEEMVRHTYNDTYAFVCRTALALQPNFREMLSTFQRTIVRSRVSILDGSHQELRHPMASWHTDEPVFINLRVNVPVATTAHHVIQSLKPGVKTEITQHPLTTGTALIYDTQKIHRPFSTDTEQRINVIIGVSPWFDFCERTQRWISNEYYGRMHPFDMFRAGAISSAIHEVQS